MSDKIISLEERLNAKHAAELEAKEAKETESSPTARVELRNNAQPAIEFETRFETIKEKKDESKETGPSTWADISSVMYQPSAVFYLVCITLLSMYLMYQSFIFFSSIEKSFISALANSFIADFIPMLAAGCLSFSVSRRQRLFCGGVLIASIIGLGLFMHSSVKSSLVNQSESSQSIAREKSILFWSLDEEIKTLKSLLETHVTKRQELEAKIRQDRLDLSRLNEQKIISTADVDTTTLSYGVWLRVAAMLMNAYLIHLFFRKFR